MGCLWSAVTGWVKPAQKNDTVLFDKATRRVPYKHLKDLNEIRRMERFGCASVDGVSEPKPQDELELLKHEE
ncbi:hypothetical protein PAPYR_5523 [Paratrimastix pyriformis]|uniref:Uncharacterized protein n=1 Tax=Paratrimastix pyriformis TaxID=342808 RepID=A0ABQ8UHP7_9EUKA|nr:hypothetical protein PAPYR_5523 [Paratrimastix pyriformis]